MPGKKDAENMFEKILPDAENFFLDPRFSPIDGKFLPATCINNLPQESSSPQQRTV